MVQWLPALPALSPVLLVIAGLLATIWLRATLVPLGLPLVFLAAGVAWASFQGQQLLDQQLPLHLERKTLTVTGAIDGLPQRNPERVRFDFRVEYASHLGQEVQVPTRIRLSAYRTEWAPIPGERWQLSVRLRRPHGFQNPGGFDYEAHLFSQRIRATGYLVEGQSGIYLGSSPWSGAIDRVRQWISTRIAQAPGPDSQTGILTALAVGDRQLISDTQWRILQHTGTSHLVAISGLHLSLVSGLIFLMVQWVWKRFEFGCLRIPAHKTAALVALVFALGYAALAGFSIPTQRALIMLAVAYTSIAVSTQPIRLHTIAVALFCVLLFDPLSVLSPGFWLSFSAVGIILFVSAGRIGNSRLVNGLRIQWAISLGLIPLTLLFFQTASITSPLANLVAIPVFALLVVPTTLLALLVLPFATLSEALLGIAGFFSSLGWSWISFLDSQGPTVLHTAAPGSLALMSSLIGLAIMGLPRGMPARWLGLFWCLPLFWIPTRPIPGTFQLTLLDVGQGLSVVVQTANHSLLFDAGARFSPDFNAGDAVVLPFLRDHAIPTLDIVIISHGDNDHIGGYPSITENITVRQLITNVQTLHGAQPCLEGGAWEWDGVRFAILHPRKLAHLSGNNDSCVLRISSKWGNALLAADIEKRTEKELVERYGSGLASNVLIAPHHGSQTSSSHSFLESVRPQWILVPAGHLNRYRHPSRKVTSRYDSKNIPWWTSGNSGAISVTFNETSLTPVAYRERYKRYWHDRVLLKSRAQ